MQREQLVLVRPVSEGTPAGLGGKRLELVQVVFVGVLRVDRLAFLECEAMALDPDLLVPLAHEMHLDAALVRDPTRVVGEGIQIEIAAEFLKDLAQLPLQVCFLNNCLLNLIGILKFLSLAEVSPVLQPLFIWLNKVMT